MDDQQNNNNKITVQDLPKTFQVKYLGFRPARGLWGIKHTRKPVDELVEAAKSLRKDESIPLATVTISQEGLSFKVHNSNEETTFSVDSISYGVQDVHFTRIFCMIVVNGQDLKEGLPFVCHAFACESRFQARQLTYALAASFENYGKKLKCGQKFAIDLRPSDEICETDA